VPASPIVGGACGAGGTAAEFVALGQAGCFLDQGARLFDVVVFNTQLPPPSIVLDPSPITITITNSVDRFADHPASSEVAFNQVPWAYAIWASYFDPEPTTGAYHEFFLEPGVLQFCRVATVACIGQQRTIPVIRYPYRPVNNLNFGQPWQDAPMGFTVTSVVPEPRMAGLTAGVLLLAALIYRNRMAHGVRNSSSR